MRVSGKTIAVALVADLAAGTCGSADSQEAPPRFELTPYAGYRFGGSFELQDGAAELDLAESNAQGILFNVRASAETQWEVLYARQSTRVETVGTFAGAPFLDIDSRIDIEHLHFGGTYLFEGALGRPFLALTAGVSRFEPGLGRAGAETFFSGSLGGGVHFRPDKRIGVRLEGRVFANLIDSDSALFCSTGPEANVCAVRLEGAVLYQWEARAGVVFRF